MSIQLTRKIVFEEMGLSRSNAEVFFSHDSIKELGKRIYKEDPEFAKSLLQLTSSQSSSSASSIGHSPSSCLSLNSSSHSYYSKDCSPLVMPDFFTDDILDKLNARDMIDASYRRESVIEQNMDESFFPNSLSCSTPLLMEDPFETALSDDVKSQYDEICTRRRRMAVLTKSQTAPVTPRQQVPNEKEMKKIGKAFWKSLIGKKGEDFSVEPMHSYFSNKVRGVIISINLT